MFEVDRIAAVVRPKDAMLNWIKEHPSKFDSVTLKNLRKDCLTLLLPTFDGPKQATAYIEQIYLGIFEAELISWGIPKLAWPEQTLELFNSWFDVEFHSMLYDIAYVEERV